LATVAVSPSIAAAKAAIAQARQATGTESPANAGASFATHSSPATRVAVADAPPAKARRAAAPTAQSAPASRAPASADGPWKVQLGAFAVHGNADKLWTSLGGRSELAGKTKLKVPAGAVVKLLAGGYPSQAAAENACRSLKQAGHDCLVTR
jgi:cell division septation protein DedD